MFFFRSGSRSFRYFFFAVIRTLLKPISRMSRETYSALIWCPRWTRIVRIFSAPKTCLYSSNTSRISWNTLVGAPQTRRFRPCCVTYDCRMYHGPHSMLHILCGSHISRKTAPKRADDLLMAQIPSNRRTLESWWYSVIFQLCAGVMRILARKTSMTCLRCLLEKIWSNDTRCCTG